MLRASKVVVALILVMGVFSAPPSSRLMAASDGDADAGQKPAQQATLKPASAASPDIPFTAYDPQAEQLLLDLANQARAQAGAPRLKLDAGMSQAARVHAEAMFAARQLSHQFDGEPSLPNAWRPQLVSNWIRKAKTSRSIPTLKKVINISCYPPRIAPTCSTRLITWSGWA